MSDESDVMSTPAWIASKIQALQDFADETHTQHLKEGAEIYPELQPEPGDEKKFNPTPGNWLAEAVGRPDWRMSAADEKAYYQGLPADMGNTGGTIAKVEGSAARAIAEKAAQKYEQAVAKGMQPTAAETLAYSKFRDVHPVLNTRQEAGIIRDKIAAKPVQVQDVADKFVAPASTVSVQGGKPAALLPLSKGSGI